MNNKQPLATLVVEIPSINGSATHHHQVLEWEHSGSKVYITMILPVVRDPNAPSWMPLRVTGFRDGAQTTLWERDWNSGGFPYLCDVEDEVVIAVLKQGKLSQIIALSALALDEDLSLARTIELKWATADEMELDPDFSVDEREAMGRIADTVVESRATEQAVIAHASPKVSRLPGKSELVATRRMKIAKRKLVTVYDKASGATCIGIPVYENEYTLCENDQHYITMNSEDVPVDYFKMKCSGNGKFHRKELVLVSPQVPAHLIHDGASLTSAQTVH